MLDINDKFTEFKIPNQNDKVIDSNDLKGKWLVLYFYPRDNTPGCTNEAIDFNENLDAFKELNTEILGVSKDSVASHKKFADKFDLKFNLLSDVKKELHLQFGAWGEKMLYGKVSTGVIRSTFIINPKGKVAARWAAVTVSIKRTHSTTKHAEMVLKKLKELI